MSLKNLTLDVESIALCLSEEGGYEYYDIDDDLKELAKNVSDMEAENERLRERIDAAHMSRLLTENENESLRELVRLMWKPFCWAQSGYEVCLTDEQDAEIRDKVRELEVEVE